MSSNLNDDRRQQHSADLQKQRNSGRDEVEDDINIICNVQTEREFIYCNFLGQLLRIGTLEALHGQKKLKRRVVLYSRTIRLSKKNKNNSSLYQVSASDEFTESLSKNLLIIVENLNESDCSCVTTSF
ncbi:3363_t:CDS:2 [Dentiscutata heterogama]|uniref:3363_t:CDS:1 n=1 Tax=Dentiscutata heterogama TaxID=1316150 RepID=A0ACA9K8S1_9GLOM|nr:3363_t:CDS:2 [Dentiscutata heterogama]